MSKYYVGDVIGIRLDTKSDRTGNTVKVLYQKPDRSTEGTWDATPNGDIVEYDTVGGGTPDVDVKGLWYIKAYDATDDVEGDLVEMRVYDRWEE